jgi:hypothetical protein
MSIGIITEEFLGETGLAYLLAEEYGKQGYRPYVFEEEDPKDGIFGIRMDDQNLPWGGERVAFPSFLGEAESITLRNMVFYYHTLAENICALPFPEELKFFFCLHPFLGPAALSEAGLGVPYLCFLQASDLERALDPKVSSRWKSWLTSALRKATFIYCDYPSTLLRFKETCFSDPLEGKVKYGAPLEIERYPLPLSSPKDEINLLIRGWKTDPTWIGVALSIFSSVEFSKKINMIVADEAESSRYKMRGLCSALLKNDQTLFCQYLEAINLGWPSHSVYKSLDLATHGMKFIPWSSEDNLEILLPFCHLELFLQETGTDLRHLGECLCRGILPVWRQESEVGSLLRKLFAPYPALLEGSCLEESFGPLCFKDRLQKVLAFVASSSDYQKILREIGESWSFASLVEETKSFV